MALLRIFSYLSNPRIAKATIVARLCGVPIEVRGAAPAELQDWLWDYEAHPLSAEDREGLRHLLRSAKTGFSAGLYKTEAFLDAHPFGTVPAAFGPHGRVGIFESNSIMRAVARLGAERLQLYGDDLYTASRIDSFLDAGLVFGRDTQIYILKLRDGDISAELHVGARRAFAAYLSGIERALQSGGGFIVGVTLSLADICFVAELTMFYNEYAHHALLQQNGLTPILADSAVNEYPLGFAHFSRLIAHEAIAPDLKPYLDALIC